MLLTEDKSAGRYQIQSYTEGQIVISGAVYTDSLIVGAEYLLPRWRPQSLLDLKPSDLDPIVEQKPELLLLGTGAHFILADPSQLLPLHRQNINVECMSTAAACRTLVALLSEGRSVLAALILGKIA